MAIGNNSYMWNNSYSNPYQNNYLNRNYMSSNLPSSQQQQFYQNNIIWVKGKENARSMQIPPNSTVILLDSEVGKFYIKTTDDIGLGKLRVFTYTEEPDNEVTTSSAPNLDLSNYVTRSEVQEMIKEIRNNE